MKSKNSILIALSFIFLLSACKSSHKLSGEYVSATFAPQCIGVDTKGNQKLRVWGKGANRQQAIRNAMQGALAAVLFDGIQGEGKCMKQPMVSLVNAREKYKEYFNNFFEIGSKYSNFVKLDNDKDSQIEAKNQSQEHWSILVTVDTEALQTQLMRDGIIK
ncbi:MAG: hypothetical protein K2M88_05885 [Muribaculaceae bacterium]|nr:hypothetical protein [Muribaculaceae bacterium]